MFSVLDFDSTSVDARSNSSKPIRKRTKTFTGCWTCRTRRIKCDEQRPKCEKCTRSGLDCGGYTLRLSWVVNCDNHRENGPKAAANHSRRALNDASAVQTGSALLSLSSTEVAFIVDKLSRTRTSQSIGPFSVFSLDECTLPSSPLSSADSGSTPNGCNSLNLASYDEDNSRCGSMLSLSDQPSRGNRSYQYNGQSLMIGMINPNVAGTVGIDDKAHTPKPSVRPNHNAMNSSIRPWSDHIPTFEPESVESRMSRHISQGSGNHWELIHHWSTFLGQNIVPADTLSNPLHTVILPCALVGLSSVSGEPNGNVAVFHALCSTAAQSLLQLKGPHKYYQGLALKHEQLSLYHLRHSISHQNTEADTALPLAILMCVINATVSGQTHHWRSHVLGGIRLLIEISNRNAHSEVMPYGWVYKTFIAVVVAGNIAIPPRLLSTLNTAGSGEDLFQQCIGFNNATLTNLLEINRLRYADPERDWREVDKFETQLWRQDPFTEPLTLTTRDTIFRHVANVLYCATLVHFLRVVRRVPTREVQVIIGKAIDSLEAIETVSNRTCGCIILWPPVVIAAECCIEGQRERVLGWFGVKRRHGFRNIEIGREICLKAWEIRSQPGQENLYWQDMAMPPEFDSILF